MSDFGFDALGSAKNPWRTLPEVVGSSIINEIASGPSPSDRINAQNRQAAQGQKPTSFDNVGSPGPGGFTGTKPGAFDGGNTPIHSFDDVRGRLTGVAPIGSRPATNPFPVHRPDAPVLVGDPNRPAPLYPGRGIGSDAEITGRVVSAMGTGPKLLWELFTKTYNSRERENVLPARLPLTEVAPQLVSQVDHWMLMGDSDMSQPRREYNNRDLRPGPTKEGHVFAVGINKQGNPVNVLEYYWGDHSMTYAGQYVVTYARDAQGLMHSRIAHYNSSEQTAQPGNQVMIGTSRNTYEGTTEYVSNNANQVISMRRFDNVPNTNVPSLGFDFSGNQTNMIWRDANSGKQMQRAVDPAQLRQTVNSQSGKFYFRDLFGP